MNRRNLPVPDNKVAKREIATNRNVSANNANAKNKVGNRAVVGANRVAVSSKADDKPEQRGLMSGGSRLPPFFIVTNLEQNKEVQPAIICQLEGGGQIG